MDFKRRESQIMKESWETWMGPESKRWPRSQEEYDEYLVAMKRAYHIAAAATKDKNSPRARHRQQQSISKKMTNVERDLLMTAHISTIASMVPDEIIANHSDYSIRTYETALMFIDVSGFTDLCEAYTKAGRGGPSKLTQVLNSYIGAMTQEILTHNGDVLKFSGDAFLSMWKKTSQLTMQDVVHTAIDCGLIIQKNYSTHVTDLGIILKVKVAISAGVTNFAIVGDEKTATYIIMGQPVWDVKAAEYVSSAGDVLTSSSTWTYVNEAEYCTQPCGDGRHTKVLGVGVTWKRVDKIGDSINAGYKIGKPGTSKYGSFNHDSDEYWDASQDTKFREYSIRPSVIAAIRSSWWPSLRRFMLMPVLRAVDNDEPMDFLTEVRHVVVVFLNVITKPVSTEKLIAIVDKAYKMVCGLASESAGLVNKVSMFDKDMMFLVVFGLRGLKYEDEAQKALLCAFQIKETLKDPEIISVSIGVTSGRTYCGVVGHPLRREYTVIGSSVNKAARLMVAYQDKVTCDKETFVRSKLDLDFFRLMEPKRLKGIADPGPIYEFNNTGEISRNTYERWPDRMTFLRHPILGRNEEIHKYKQTLLNAMNHQHENFTKYRDLRYGIIIMGSRMVGKQRLLDEFLYITPNYMRSEKITLTEADKQPFQLTRTLLQSIILDGNSYVTDMRSAIENKIRFSLNVTELTPLQIYSLNVIFNERFPLPENFQFAGDLISEPSVKELIRDLFKPRRRTLKVLAIREGQHIDDESWRVLIILMETKDYFPIIVLNDQENISPTAKGCIAKNIFVKIHLTGIDRWYHAALACQLLDVQAIPADLEKVMESASGGLPGWIQNFVISLIQRGVLTVVTVPRSEAIEAGAVLPSTAMLQRMEDNSTSREVDVISLTSNKLTSFQSFTSVLGRTADVNTFGTDNEYVQMAVLVENFNFADMKLDMTMDVIILKTYDSLTPFEKMLLKCGSVLGDVFSRRMLLHLLQGDQRKVAQAVAKLFEIRVLECEGGDFTRDTSMVLVHPAPVSLATMSPPFCACLGTRVPPTCRDLPMYAFCGYMKFKHSLFRTTTYELLTENQKQEMHARALLYLERYTRRCSACGAGCFNKLFGVRIDDGLVRESKQLQLVRRQISALSNETRMTSDSLYNDFNLYSQIAKIETLYHDDMEMPGKQALNPETRSYRTTRTVRSFSSLNLESCECLLILMSVYSQVIEHCRAVGECEKLFETYMEYVGLSMLNLNIPQAIRLLFEAEEAYLPNPGKERSIIYCTSELCKIPWIKDYRMARILTSRGGCMLELGDYSESKTNLLQAMKLYGFPFPSNRCKVKMLNAQASFQQFMTLYLYRGGLGKETGFTATFYDSMCNTLNKLYVLFTEYKEFDNAELAAKWSLEFAWKGNSSFRLLCMAYSQMISIYREKLNFTRCRKLEKMAMKICHRKRGQLDITEVHSVCTLYTNIFLFYVENGRKVESLEFGMSVIPMMSSLQDITTGQMLVLWLLKLLLLDLRIKEMVLIMREFFYMTDYYDLSSETWYYYYATKILLETGYCVESYRTCEKFYITKGDAIIRSKTPEAAWNFFVSMWLMTVRLGVWEKSILWEDKIRQVIDVKYRNKEFRNMALTRLAEGFLISLVNEINNRNIKKILIVQKHVKTLFKIIQKDSKPIFKPRFLLLSAYYNLLRGKKRKAFRLLDTAAEAAKSVDLNGVMVWIQHTRSHWKGTLNPKHLNYWADHVEPENQLDYRDFDPDFNTIIPYTLPLPTDFEI